MHGNVMSLPGCWHCADVVIALHHCMFDLKKVLHACDMTRLHYQRICINCLAQYTHRIQMLPVYIRTELEAVQAVLVLIKDPRVGYSLHIALSRAS